MSPEAKKENVTSNGALDGRIAALVEKIQKGPEKPINFENLYTGEALRAIAPYGGLATIREARNKLWIFVREFENKNREGKEKLSPEIIERAEESLQILYRVDMSVSESDKKAAEVIAKDLLRRAKALKETGALSLETVDTINAIYDYIHKLLKEGLIDKAHPDNFEDKFPLAYTLKKVREIEFLMIRATDRRKNPNAFWQEQMQTEEKPQKRK